jgi:DNA-binding GntR family transcriptional regulator
MLSIILFKKDLLEQRKRLGTIVRRNKIQQEFTHLIQSYNQEMSTKGLKTKTKYSIFKKSFLTQRYKQNLTYLHLIPYLN